MPSLLSSSQPAPPPVEQQVEPVPEPAPQPAPEQQAAPPPEQSAPKGYTLLDDGPEQSAPTTQQSANSDISQTNQKSELPPASTGSATDAIGATAQTAKDLPANWFHAVKGGAVQGAVQEFAPGTKDRAPQYQPAPDDVEGESREAAYERTHQAIEGYEQAKQGGPGNFLNILGGAKDVAVAKLGENMGEVSPERANQTEWQTERLTDELTTGDPFASKPDADILERSLWNLPINSGGGYADWARANPETFLQAAKQGYTTPEGFVYAEGLRAPWEVFQSTQSGLERGLNDLAMAPLSMAADAAATLLGGAGMGIKTAGKEAIERGTGRTVMGIAPQTAQRVGTGLQVAGRGVDAAATMGLSEIVPGGFKAIGKAYGAIPWAGKQTEQAALSAAADAGQQAADEATTLMRAGAGQPGVPGAPTPSLISSPTGDPLVQRVVLPDDGVNGPIDLTYRTDKKGKLVGVYDTAIPGPTDRYRGLTQADAQTIYDAWGRLPAPDRQTLRQAAYPQLSRVETSPGEPFIEQAAEKVYDDAGNLLADTGRTGSGYQREVDDLRRTILRDGRPDQIITDFTSSWKQTLYDAKQHPLTRRSLAEHRLQTLRDVVDSLPASYKTPEITTHLREMAALLPKQAPGAIGTGTKWRGPATGTGGAMIPLNAREQTWLREVATMPLKRFTKGALDVGRVSTAKGGIIFDRKPPPSAPPAFQNGYTTYLDVMDFRVKNPPTSRAEISALKNELTALKARPTPAAAAREGAIRDVFERTNIVPGASNPALLIDDLIVQTEGWLRANRPTFPQLPGAVAGPASGTYEAGSMDELYGMELDDKLREALEHTIDINGTSRTIGQRNFTNWEETHTAYEIAKQQARGIPPSSADEKALNAQIVKIVGRFPAHKGLTGPKLAAMPPEEVDRIAAALTRADIEMSQGVRNPTTGRMLTPMEQKGLIGKGGVVLDNFNSMWRSTVLYNLARGGQYVALQHVGNTLSAVLTGNWKTALLYQNPVRAIKSFKMLRNPETATPTRAVEIRGKVGLPRHRSLMAGVSRDEIGPKSWYSQGAVPGEKAHPAKRFAGFFLGNQTIKELADSRDLGFRNDLWQTAFDGGYTRLKRDVPDMAETRFADFATRRGVPIPITRDQIDAAVKQVEAANGGYYSQPQLRQALYEAAGGNGAANAKTVYDAADRIARDYQTEVKKLDEAALAEVDRVAFSSGDTNFENALQRTMMFTWWVSRATRLYATEAAKSPIQMGLWARLMESENQRVREGANPRFKTMLEFLSTPAGYTASLNEMSLLGTYLFGTSADPADERANLTALGKLFEGGPIGESLMLSPVWKGLGYALGAFGEDSRTPDMLGTNRLERELNDGLNWVNQNLYQFHSTKGGNPERIPLLNVGPGVVNRMAQFISGHLPGTQQVSGYDPETSFSNQMAGLVSEQALRDNPEMDPNDPQDAETLRRDVDAALANHDSPWYQEALGRYTDGQYLGPGSTGEGGWRDVVGAVTSHWLFPSNFSRMPEYRADVLAGKGRDQLREDGATNLTTETETNEFEGKIGSVGAMTDEAREVQLIRDAAEGDPQTQATRDTFHGLLYGDLSKIPPEGIAVDGYNFTAEQLASLPEADRRVIANRWLDASGGRALMNQYEVTYQEQLKADTRFANAEGLDNYARQYPGGVDRFVDETAQINPNYKRFIEGSVVLSGHLQSLPELRVTDHEKWVQVVTSFDQARYVIAGVKDSRYGNEVDPKYAGLVAGLDGETVGTWYIKEQSESHDTEFVANMRSDYETISEVGANLDKYDAAIGRPVGTGRAEMASHILSGAEYPVSLDTKQAMESFGLSAGGKLVNPYGSQQYVQWSIGQPAGSDTSIDAYNDAYWSQKNAEQIPLIATRLATGQVPPPAVEGAPPADPFGGVVATADGGVAPGVRGGQATLARPVVVASEPGGRQGTTVTPPATGLQVQTGRLATGTDGSVWIEVTHGPVTGWVLASDLAA